MNTKGPLNKKKMKKYFDILRDEILEKIAIIYNFEEPETFDSIVKHSILDSNLYCIFLIFDDIEFALNYKSR